MSTNQELNYFTWKTKFDATVVIDGCVYPNNYSVEISFLPKINDIKAQNIYFDKIKYLFNTLCENSLIFNINDSHKDFWFTMPINKILLPNAPYDQLLAICIRKKIQSIAEKYFHIGEISIDSKLGDNVKYVIDDESYENNTVDDIKWEHKWWERDDTATFDQTIDDSYWSGAVSWVELGYEYKTTNSAKFKPTIIDGGREK